MLVKNISWKTMKVRVQGEEMNIIQSNTIQTTLDKANELVANYPWCFEIIKDADAYVQDIVDGGGAGTSGLEQRVEALETEVDNKVDKEDWKGLSTNDYTDADKTAVEDIANKVDKENWKGLSTNDFSDAYKASLDLLSDRLDAKLNKDRGVSNAWKYLRVGADGNVTETSTVSYMQKPALPTASEAEEGNIYQYVGETTEDYTNWYFYKCIESSGVYVWMNIPVQSSGQGTNWAPNSPLKPPYFWCGSDEQYKALSQYYTVTEDDTIYFSI